MTTKHKTEAMKHTVDKESCKKKTIFQVLLNAGTAYPISYSLFSVS